MSDLSALVYLEARMLVNRVRQILRRPSRLIFWIIFILWFGSFVFIRTSRAASGIYTATVPDEFRLFYAFVPAGYLIILGAQVMLGCRRPPATFAYPADARFLFGSRLPNRLVIFWLQLREAFFSGTRMFFVLFVSAWAFASSPTGLIAAAIALAAIYIIAFAVRLPAFLANRRFPRLHLAWWGAAMIGAGIVALAYPLAVAIATNDVHLSFLAQHTLQFPPGSWLVSALGGHQASLVWLCALAAGVVGIGSVASGDAYPELWEASSRLYAFRSLAASGRVLWNREAWRKLHESDPARPSRAPDTAASVSGDHTPAGAFTNLWKEWLALRRTAGGLRWPFVWLIAGAAVGYLAGIAAVDYSIFISLALVLPALNTIIVIGSQASVLLSNEIRRPLWWLAHSELRDRLLVWAAAGLLRVAPPLILAVIVGGAVMRNWLLVVGAVPLTLALLMLIRAIGLACYVILPGRNDLRGPGFLLRFFATYVLLLPPAAVWTFLQVLTTSVIAGALGGLFFAAVETYALISFGALRLEENALAYAAAEER